MPNLHSSFRVRFANGQRDSYCGTLAEARRRITRRAEYDPPPPGIFPAEIWEAVVDLDTPEDERRAVPMEWHLVERFPLK
jgi:hypothetical protein